MTGSAEGADDKPRLPTTVKRAEKYERTVGHETQQDKPLSLTLSLSHSLSVCLIRFKSCYTSTKECLIYPDTSGKEKSSKKKKRKKKGGTAEGSIEAAGVVLPPLCLYNRTTWRGAWQYCKRHAAVTHKSRHIRTELLHTLLT